MDITSYKSPFSERYGTEAIRELLSYKRMREEWRKAWEKLAEKQGLNPFIPDGALVVMDSDYDRAKDIETHTHHDLTAELELFEKLVPDDAKLMLHIGVTSSDIEDEAEHNIYQECLQALKTYLLNLEIQLLDRAQANLGTVILGRTHLQPAEPTILGYRFLWYAERLEESGLMLYSTRRKGFHGAVGTNANLEKWYGPGPREFTHYISSFQTAPRQWDLEMLSAFSQVASVLHKMAFDIRLMAMEGTLAEHKTQGQIGSSAMPNKQNPITAEKICGLARLFPGYYNAIWTEAANTLLERTLDDSSTRRVIIPEAILNMSELLVSADTLIATLVIQEPKQLLWNVIDNWRSWLPSRILAKIRTTKPVMYTDIYPKVERWANTCKNEFELIGMCAEYLEEQLPYDLKYWFQLDEVKDFTLKRIKSLRSEIIKHYKQQKAF